MRISSMSYLSRQNNRNLSRSYQKLSSGKRINSAADDAAGLAIAQKLLKQANGLNAGVYNARNSQNMLNVAEGAMGSVTDSLQRMNELSIQAANGTYPILTGVQYRQRLTSSNQRLTAYQRRQNLTKTIC